MSIVAANKQDLFVKHQCPPQKPFFFITVTLIFDHDPDFGTTERALPNRILYICKI